MVRGVCGCGCGRGVCVRCGVVVSGGVRGDTLKNHVCAFKTSPCVVKSHVRPPLLPPLPPPLLLLPHTTTYNHTHNTHNTHTPHTPLTTHTTHTHNTHNTHTHTQHTHTTHTQHTHTQHTHTHNTHNTHTQQPHTTTQHNTTTHTTLHSTTQHRIRHTEAKRREEGDCRRNQRRKRVLTCIRGSPTVNLWILPIHRFESWSRTTSARICHAQPLSRSLYIYIYIYIYTNSHVHAYIYMYVPRCVLFEAFDLPRWVHVFCFS